MPDERKMEDSKSVCFWCKNAHVLDCMRVQSGVAADAMGRPMLNPITQQPMIETRTIYAYTVVCHARGGALPLLNETIVLQCTDFVEMEQCPELHAPAEEGEAQPENPVN